MHKRLLSLTAAVLIVIASIAQSDTTNQEPDITSFIVASQEPTPVNMNDIRTAIGYPAEAIEQDIEGQVVVRVLVDEKGAYVKHKTIKKGHPILAEQVEKHIDKLKFTPAIQEDNPIKFWVNIPFSFKLLDPEDEAKIAMDNEIKRLGEEIEKDPSSYQPYTTRGLQYTSMGEYEKALADFDKSISLNPGKNKKKKVLDYPYLFYANLGKGKMYLAQKQWSDAQSALDNAINIADKAKSEDAGFRTTIPTAYAERGSALAQLELYEAARRDYDKAMINTDSANTCAVLGLKYELCLKTEDYKCVVACLNGLLECESENEYNALLYNRGYYKMKYNDFTGAIADFKDMLNRTDNTYLRIAAFDQMAMANFDNGDAAAAIKNIDAAMNINVLHPQPYFYKAKILMKQNKKAEACELIERSLSYGLQGEDKEEAEKLQVKLCE